MESCSPEQRELGCKAAACDSLRKPLGFCPAVVCQEVVPIAEDSWSMGTRTGKAHKGKSQSTSTLFEIRARS